MIRTIRVITFTTGVIIGLYGALNDYEPLTLIGALLIVVGLMLPVFIDTNKK